MVCIFSGFFASLTVIFLLLWGEPGRSHCCGHVNVQDVLCLEKRGTVVLIQQSGELCKDCEVFFYLRHHNSYFCKAADCVWNSVFGVMLGIPVVWLLSFIEGHSCSVTAPVRKWGVCWSGQTGTFWLLWWVMLWQLWLQIHHCHHFVCAVSMVEMRWICWITVLDSCGCSQCRVSIRVPWHSGVHTGCAPSTVLYCKRWFGLTSLPWAELNLKCHRIPQGCVQLSFLCLQGWRSDSLPGQFLSLSNQPCCGEVFSFMPDKNFLFCSLLLSLLPFPVQSGFVFVVTHYTAEESSKIKKIPSLAFCFPGQKGTWSEPAD